MKRLVFFVLLALMNPAVLADAGMIDSGMMTGGMFGMGLLLLVYFAIGAFIFSVIFWLTHNWLYKAKKR